MRGEYLLGHSRHQPAQLTKAARPFAERPEDQHLPLAADHVHRRVDPAFIRPRPPRNRHGPPLLPARSPQGNHAPPSAYLIDSGLAASLIRMTDNISEKNRLT